MALRERTIPRADFQNWKKDLETTGFHVVDSLPHPGLPGFCTLRFEPGANHVPGPGAELAARATARRWTRSAPRKSAPRKRSLTSSRPVPCSASTARSR